MVRYILNVTYINVKQFSFLCLLYKSLPSLHFWICIDIPVLSIVVFSTLCMHVPVFVHAQGWWCYLTDVGADASLPETLTAELHCHLTAHSVLLTDLLKSFLPNNQPVNHWSTGAQPTGTARILKTPPSHPPFLSLMLSQKDRPAQAIKWNKLTHTEHSSGQKQQGKWWPCWSWLIEALQWVSMAAGSGCGKVDTEAQVPANKSWSTCLPIRTTTPELRGTSMSHSRIHYRNTKTHTHIQHHVSITWYNWKFIEGAGWVLDKRVLQITTEVEDVLTDCTS